MRLARALASLVLASAASAQERASDSASIRRAPLWLFAWANTTRASETEGPVWLGRGATLAASAGIEGRRRAFSYAVRPVVYVSQNAAYDPSETLSSTEFTDPWFGGFVDKPYRFGDDVFARFDAGESFVRVDNRWVGGGVSSAARRWGPAHLEPLVLSGRTGGFPHAFIETNAPVNVGIGRVSGEWIAGRLTASGYGTPHPGTTHRLAVGAIASIEPRGLDGFEIGVSRFFHLYDTAGVRDLQTLLLPFSELLKDRLAGGAEARSYNQLASVFARVAPRGSPLEVYGEYLRDDHAANLRDAAVEPDHNSAFLLGVRRVGTRGDADRRIVIVELVNGRFTHLMRVRPQGATYTHTDILEGHTHRGRLLGSRSAMGGGGLSTAWRREQGAGRDARAWTVGASLVRVAQDREGGSFRGEMTGYYALEIAREQSGRGGHWRTVMRLEPAFGDLRGVNLGVGARVTR